MNMLKVLQSLKYHQLVVRPILSERMMSGVNNEKPVETSIKNKLSETFKPSYLEVNNESYMHSVPKGSETHFKVVVVSEKFENLPLIKRHRLVNEALKEELDSGVHALSMVTKTLKQWEDSGEKVGKSPPCMGGAGL